MMEVPHAAVIDGWLELKRDIERLAELFPDPDYPTGVMWDGLSEPWIRHDLAARYCHYQEWRSLKRACDNAGVLLPTHPVIRSPVFVRIGAYIRGEVM